MLLVYVLYYLTLMRCDASGWFVVDCRAWLGCPYCVLVLWWVVVWWCCWLACTGCLQLDGLGLGYGDCC